jgi:site-specific DNA-methyltransferase (adenine-specific)
MMIAIRTCYGENDMLAYMTEMGIRLVEMHRVLKSTGSLFLHCDSSASHYIKLILDTIFLPKNFRNEIIWRRTGSHNKIRRFGPVHDTIFFYSKTDSYKWKYPKKPFMREHVEKYFIKDEKGYKTNYYGNVLTGSGIRNGESGKPWRGIDPTAKGRHWAISSNLTQNLDEDISGLSQHEKLELLYSKGTIKITTGQYWPIPERYLQPSDGQPISDIWAYQPYTNGTVFGTNKGIDEDIRWLSQQDQERLGYQTQKPEGLLRRIIEACTDPGDIVLDTFCGCGTTIAVAEKLARKWIGIDITHLAIALIKDRLDNDADIDSVTLYDIIGIPKDVESARALSVRDRYEFQYWALSLIKAKPYADKKKGADEGQDGFIYFRDVFTGKQRKVIVSVKSGHVGAKDIRDLKGVIVREKADFGAFITLELPTNPMVKEGLKTGFFEIKIPDGILSFPKLQILTINDLLNGKSLMLPDLSAFRMRITKNSNQINEERDETYIPYLVFQSEDFIRKNLLNNP